MSNISLARRKYTDHRISAKNKNIPFNITFEEWYNWWLRHGIDKNKPSSYPAGHRDMPCMCRKNDSGAYELANIYFDSSSNNVKFRNKNNPNFICKKIMTPYGLYDSRKAAAIALAISPNMVNYYVKHKPSQYYYI